MNSVAPDVVIVADDAAAGVRLCGISMIERLLRDLQRAGMRKATIIGARTEAAVSALKHDSWARCDVCLTDLEPTKSNCLVEDVIHCVGPAAGDILLVRAGAYYDPRLLRAAAGSRSPTITIDSDPPSKLRDLLAGTSRIDDGIMVDLALIDRSWLTTLSSTTPIFSALQTRTGDVTVARLDVAKQPAYRSDMRRSIRPLWFPVPTQENIRLATDSILDAAQNGTLDLPAIVHAPIESAIVARLCWSSVTPNQVTAATALAGVCVTALFATGRLWAGAALALIVGLLDGIDGKLARVKVETTTLGAWEHQLDFVIEMSWWAALAFAAQTLAPRDNSCAYWWLLLLVSSDLADRLAKRSVKSRIGRNLDDASPFDRTVRLIGGRRNIYIWMFAIALLMHAPIAGFRAICGWAAITAAVHALRALQFRRGSAAA